MDDGQPAMTLRVLVATDGSEPSALAIDQVAGISWPAGTNIRVVQAIPQGVAVFGGPWPPTPPVDAARIEEELRRRAEDSVAAAAARLAGPGRGADWVVRAGRAADVILDEARASAADLIMVGSRGQGTIGSMLLGSVSSEVIDHAEVPVWVARRGTLGRVVLAWDGSACAASAAELLLRWPIFRQAAVRVVSVAHAAYPVWIGLGATETATLEAAYENAAEPSRTQHELLARDMADRLREAGIDASPDRRDGDPAAQILNVAQAWPADLIVMGSHGRTGVARLLLGSVARNVLHHAPCSVLVVRQPEGGSAP